MNIKVTVESDNAIQDHLQQFDHSLIGVGSGDKNYVHTQMTSQSIWVITHNLSKNPSVTILTNDDEEVFGNVEYLNSNSLKISFSVPFSGKAILN